MALLPLGSDKSSDFPPEGGMKMPQYCWVGWKSTDTAGSVQPAYCLAGMKVLALCSTIPDTTQTHPDRKDEILCHILVRLEVYTTHSVFPGMGGDGVTEFLCCVATIE